MKNQYFGDINDYKKYSLLRLLSGNGDIRTAVCWALTQDDGGTDGSRTRYLEQPDAWGGYDPVVYEHLREQVLVKRIRDVGTLERENVLPNSLFHRDIVSDDAELRDKYFDKFLKLARGVELVFFDPDNGLEVKSVPRGKKKSSKYIYWNEIEMTFASGHSLLIYQHFPRRPREPFIRSLIQRFKDFCNVRQVFCYYTIHVAFLLIPQPHHEAVFVKNSAKVEETWGNLIRVQSHPTWVRSATGKRSSNHPERRVLGLTNSDRVVVAPVII